VKSHQVPRVVVALRCGFQRLAQPVFRVEELASGEMWRCVPEIWTRASHRCGPNQTALRQEAVRPGVAVYLGQTGGGEGTRCGVSRHTERVPAGGAPRGERWGAPDSLPGANSSVPRLAAVGLSPGEEPDSLLLG